MLQLLLQNLVLRGIFTDNHFWKKKIVVIFISMGPSVKNILSHFLQQQPKNLFLTQCKPTQISLFSLRIVLYLLPHQVFAQQGCLGQEWKEEVMLEGCLLFYFEKFDLNFWMLGGNILVLRGDFVQAGKGFGLINEKGFAKVRKLILSWGISTWTCPRHLSVTALWSHPTFWNSSPLIRE